MKPTEIIGNCHLYLGDCREILPSLPKVDLVLTDPPYGIGYAAQPTRWQRMNGKEPETWDNSAPHDLVAAAIEKGLGAIVWGGNYFNVRPSRGWLAWYKPDGPQSFADFELAWTSFDMNTRLFIKSSKAASLERGVAAFAHPNQKPVGLIEWCLNLAPKNTSTVADPFAGSGTTGVACVRMGKKFYGIERERKYFDIMCERIQREVDRPQLFPFSCDTAGTSKQDYQCGLQQQLIQTCEKE